MLKSPYARSDRSPPREYKQTVAEQACPLPDLIKGQRVEKCIYIYCSRRVDGKNSQDLLKKKVQINSLEELKKGNIEANSVIPKK